MSKQKKPPRKRKMEVLHANEQTFSDDRKAACSAMNTQANEMAVKAKLALHAKLLKKRMTVEREIDFMSPYETPYPLWMLLLSLFTMQDLHSSDYTALLFIVNICSYVLTLI